MSLVSHVHRSIAMRYPQAGSNHMSCDTAFGHCMRGLGDSCSSVHSFKGTRSVLDDLDDQVRSTGIRPIGSDLSADLFLSYAGPGNPSWH